MVERPRCRVGHFWAKVKDDILQALQVYILPLWRNRPPKLSNSAKITQNKGSYSVQSHSRSPMSLPIESLYASSY